MAGMVDMLLSGLGLKAEDVKQMATDAHAAVLEIDARLKRIEEKIDALASGDSAEPPS